MKDEKEHDDHPSSEPLEADGSGLDSNQTDAQLDEDSEDSSQKSSTDGDESVLQSILDVILHLSNETSALKNLIENRLKYDSVKEEAFERLYVELEEYKKNSVFERNRPLFTDLILYFDRIENMRLNFDSSTIEKSHFSSLLKTLSDEILEILHRQGVEMVDHSRSFNPAIQRAISTQPTSVEEEDNQVSKIVRKGFKYSEKILRAEEVIVKKFKYNYDSQY